jgi:DNA topoisomerase I
MRDRHVSISRGTLHFEFQGKSGKKHEIDLRDARLAKIVQQAQDLPGQELFQYIDDHGQRQTISSEDVNDYLRKIAGAEFSAKDFRTWAGTVLAAVALREFERFDTQAQAKKNVVMAIERVAERLGNTPTICRKCYIHPAVLASYLSGETMDLLRAKTERTLERNLSKLSAAEAAVLAFLQQKLRQPKPSTMDLLRRSIAQGRRPGKHRDLKQRPEAVKAERPHGNQSQVRRRVAA